MARLTAKIEKISLNSKLLMASLAALVLTVGGIGSLFSMGESKYFWYLVVAGCIAIAVLIVISWRIHRVIKKLLTEVEAL